MIAVFGHRHPDSDSICCAIVVADWLRFCHNAATAYRLGEINPETQFLLAAAQIEAPALLSKSVKNRPVWLVDFSDLEQGPEGLADSDVIGLIDHHRLGSLITAQPLDAWIRKVGCCATVVVEVIRHTPDYQLSPAHALLLLGAILSDTVAFQSPTTTETDRQTAQQLANIANINLTEFSLKLLQAKTDISGLSVSQLLQKDEKSYLIAGRSLILAQIEISDFAVIESQLDALKQEMERRVNAEQLDFYLLMVTSLSTSQSRLYFSKQNPISQEVIVLQQTLSRKKQVLPWLTQQLQNQQN